MITSCLLTAAACRLMPVLWVHRSVSIEYQLPAVAGTEADDGRSGSKTVNWKIRSECWEVATRPKAAKFSLQKNTVLRLRQSMQSNQTFQPCSFIQALQLLLTVALEPRVTQVLVCEDADKWDMGHRIEQKSKRETVH